MAVPVNDLQGSNPSSLIELFQLELSPVLHKGAYVSPGIKYFYSGVNEKTPTSKITWNGQAYDPLPIVVEGIEYRVKGSLPRPTLRVSNILGTMSDMLNTINDFIDPDTGAKNIGQDLAGAKLTRIRTLVKYIDHVNWTGKITNSYTRNNNLIQIIVSGSNNPGFSSGDTVHIHSATKTSSGNDSVISNGAYQIYSTSSGSNTYTLFLSTTGGYQTGTLTFTNPFSSSNPFGTPSPTTKFPDDVYFINKKILENQLLVEFELRSILDFSDLKLPKRQVLRKEFPGVGDFYES